MSRAGLSPIQAAGQPWIGSSGLVLVEGMPCGQGWGEGEGGGEVRSPHLNLSAKG